MVRTIIPEGEKPIDIKLKAQHEAAEAAGDFGIVREDGSPTVNVDAGEGRSTEIPVTTKEAVAKVEKGVISEASLGSADKNQAEIRANLEALLNGPGIGDAVDLADTVLRASEKSKE